MTYLNSVSKILFLIVICIGIFSCQQKASSPTPELKNRWFKAVKDGDFERLSQMHDENKLSWNFRNEHDHSTLMSACHFGHLELVRKLIELNVEVNSLDQKNFNALAYAVYGTGDNDSKAKIIDLLLEKEGDPFVETDFNSRALFAMIENNLIEPMYKIKWGIHCESYPEKNFSIVKFAQKHRQYYLAAFLQHQGCP